MVKLSFFSDRFRWYEYDAEDCINKYYSQSELEFFENRDSPVNFTVCDKLQIEMPENCFY